FDPGLQKALDQAVATHPEGTLLFVRAFHLSLKLDTLPFDWHTDDRSTQLLGEVEAAFVKAADAPSVSNIRAVALDFAAIHAFWLARPKSPAPDRAIQSRAAQHIRRRLAIQPLDGIDVSQKGLMAVSTGIARGVRDHALARLLLMEWHRLEP